MKSFMNIKMPRNTVHDIVDDVDQILEMWRLAFVERRPLEAAEWRRGMNILIAVKIACVDAVRQEEAND